MSDFVPDEGMLLKFAFRFHPKINELRLILKSFQISTLLDNKRLIALMEIARYAASNFNGEIIKFGTYKGGSAAAVAWFLSAAGVQRAFHLCDTFKGLPSSRSWEHHNRGDFSDLVYKDVVRFLGSLLPGYPFKYHRGLFSETLPALAEKKFCFAHVDADLYDSVLQACKFLYTRMAKGGVIIFDDYGHINTAGAKKAVDEFFSDKPECPAHITRCAYGVIIGIPHPNFTKIILKGTLMPAVSHFLKCIPMLLKKIMRKMVRRLFSPQTALCLCEPLFRLNGQRVDNGKTPLAQARQILVVRPDKIGDMVLTTPFLRELRKNNPSARITLVVSPNIYNLVELCPYVDQISTFDFRKGVFPRIGAVIRRMRIMVFAFSSFLKKRFDLAILPRWFADDYDASFMIYFSGARSRVGYTENTTPSKSRRNEGYDA
ncbi:MAG: class I SAM-dependent methyltransferase, partial [Candidatus Omnitrophica bacterium]|nr:class I SAM-dependent methyltransferase [Candidatus Omnitrophota bacterium]